MSRTAEIDRKTGETQVTVALDLDGGEVSASTGVGFLVLTTRSLRVAQVVA